MGVGINVSDRETIHHIAKERFFLIIRKRIFFSVYFCFLSFRFSEFYLSVLKFTTSILSSLYK